MEQVTKETYEKPHLQDYGRLSDITESNGSCNVCDAASGGSVGNYDSG